jgi:DNA-binding transcriptional regulator of glucitol operon
VQRRDNRGKVRVLLTPGWIVAHVGMLVVVAAFLALGWWQVNRAADGNLLSFGYAFEWPAFAAFVIWVWIVEMRKAVRRAAEGEPDDPAEAEPKPQEQTVRSDPPAPSRRGRSRNQAAYDDTDDPELAAYNHYLAWINANPHRSSADYPGLPDTAPAKEETTA